MQALSGVSLLFLANAPIYEYTDILVQALYGVSLLFLANAPIYEYTDVLVQALYGVSLLFLATDSPDVAALLQALLMLY